MPLDLGIHGQMHASVRRALWAHGWAEDTIQLPRGHVTSVVSALAGRGRGGCLSRPELHSGNPREESSAHGPARELLLTRGRVLHDCGSDVHATVSDMPACWSSLRCAASSTRAAKAWPFLGAWRSQRHEKRVIRFVSVSQWYHTWSTSCPLVFVSSLTPSAHVVTSSAAAGSIRRTRGRRTSGRAPTLIGLRVPRR